MLKRSTKHQSRWVLPLILILGTVVRLPHLGARLVMNGDWGSTQFLIYARNYRDLGWFTENTIPYFGMLDGQAIVYANHPWLASILLGLWGWPFNYSELSYRSLALIFSLLTTYAVYLLGTRLGDNLVGWMAAALFIFSPLSIYMGRSYCMEPVHIAFMLFGFYFYLKWRAGEGGFRRCLGFLALAQLSDIYGLFFSLWVVLVWIRNFKKTKVDTWRWASLAGVPILVQAGLMVIVSQRALGRHAWDRGVSRAGKPWLDWLDPHYWWTTANLVLWNYAYLLPLFVLVASLISWLQGLKQCDKSKEVLSFLWFYPLLYTLAGTEWMKNHTHLVIFYGPVLALHASSLLRRFAKPIQGLFLLVHMGVSLKLSWGLYLTPLSFYHEELKQVPEIQTMLRPEDVVIGLPPHIAYYVDHKASVPYDYFLRSDATDSAAVNEILRSLILSSNAPRVFLFYRFVQWPAGLKSLALENVFSSDDQYRLARRSQTVFIWERKKTSGTP